MIAVSRWVLVIGLAVIVFGTWANLRASFSQTVPVDDDRQVTHGIPSLFSSSELDVPRSQELATPIKKSTINIKHGNTTVQNIIPIGIVDSKASKPVTATHNRNNNNNIKKTQLSSRTKMVGFADGNYKEYAITWYRRLEALGYTEQVIVAVDQETEDYLQQQHPTVRFERLAYPPCLSAHDADTRRYRRQLFARRWKYLYDQLVNNHHVLLTDVDNVFSRYLSFEEFENSEYDVFHAYSTSYPDYVFYDMGLTVCGGMGWYRASSKVRQFVGTLLNKCKCWKSVDCNCYCDDQVVLNELLWKGKHNVTWDMTSAQYDIQTKPQSLNDWKWKSISGVSSKTQHKIKIWDRNLAYRAPMPESCPKDNWVAMPLYVNRSIVAKEWDRLCRSNALQ